MVAGLPVPGQVLIFDNWIMLLAVAMLIPVLLGRMKLNRAYAGVFLVLYFAYVGAQAYGVDRLLGAI